MEYALEISLIKEIAPLLCSFFRLFLCRILVYMPNNGLKGSAFYFILKWSETIPLFCPELPDNLLNKYGGRCRELPVLVHDRKQVHFPYINYQYFIMILFCKNLAAPR